MAQQHGDRLTAVDASFLAQEGRPSHMHVGAVMIFEGPAPALDALADHVRARLHLVPRFRQKLAFPPLETGRPLWVDDPSFNLEYHVRHTALPAPGSEEQLRALAARVHSQALDRSKPLWEMWLVQGLEGGRFALITKTHHALVDGVAGVDLATVLFDLTPEPAAVEHDDRAVDAAADAERRRHGRARRARRARRCRSTATARAVGAARRPATALHETREALEGLGEVVWAGLNPAPDDAAQRRDRPAPPARLRAPRARRLQARSRTRSAARSTTSCSPSSPARCRSGCARAACAPRGWSCARSCRSRSAPATSTTSSATGSPRCAGRCPSTSRTRSPGCGRAPGDGRAQGLQAGGRRRGARRHAGARAADDPRPGLAAELLHAPVQPARHQRARAAVPALRARAAGCRTCSRSRSCPSATRSRSRSCPTTAGWTSACSATTTRCPTSTRSASCSTESAAELLAAARERRRRGAERERR